jgi:hypothetical protein
MYTTLPELPLSPSSLGARADNLVARLAGRESKANILMGSRCRAAIATNSGVVTPTDHSGLQGKMDEQQEAT